jgi:hypothetical protein
MGQTKHYSDYLNSMCGLVGVPRSRLTTETSAAFNVYFNTGMRRVWQARNWIDICPYGEARFPGNLLTSANNFTNTAWTLTAATATANAIANPLDGNTTASSLLETSATSQHKAVQTLTFFPNISYQVSVYARPINRNYIYVAVSDGSDSFTSFFNVYAGTLGTASANVQATITPQSNGFYCCNLYFTTSASAGSGSVSLNVSTDGSTISYAGDASKGLYLYGANALQTQYPTQNSTLIPWAQSGENVIDSIFSCWMDYPASTPYPRNQQYQLTQNGIQVLTNGPTYYVDGVANPGVATTSPTFIYYRKATPDYTGDTYDAALTYAVGDQIYFTNSDGSTDYYRCVVATSAGQSPTTTPASWSVREIPEPLFWPSVWYAYADWLTSDGQADKATGAQANAQQKVDEAADREERQMGFFQPTQFFTHLYSRTTY